MVDLEEKLKKKIQTVGQITFMFQQVATRHRFLAWMKHKGGE